jgi:hypothetical protein
MISLFLFACLDVGRREGGREEEEDWWELIIRYVSGL